MRVTRRPMPVEQSIHWKPLRDSHYVVASLQPADGGRRRIFVRQHALANAEALTRATHGRRAFGLLLGQLYRCPETGADYLVIESITDPHGVPNDGGLVASVRQALEQTPDRKAALVVGWYCSASIVEAKPPDSAVAIHTACFGQPWQTTLVMADATSVPGGAFFLHDTANSRWFYAPFYELADHPPATRQHKATCVSWPQYLTADTVVPAAREPTPASRLADVPAARPYQDPTPARPPRGDHGTDAVPTVERADARWPTLPAVGAARDPVLVDGPPDDIRDDVRGLADRPPSASAGMDSVAIPETYRERIAARFSDRPVEKPPTVDDGDRRRAGRRGARRVGDTEDTAAGDEPARFIELARAEGFFVAAEFNSGDRTGRAETLWVLNEPYSGILLTVVGGDAEVVDASLHYNLHTDDAGVWQTPFPEHRDPESRTVYVRETCVDALRARCRRLRATNALEREWKVSPTMLLLMPNEWESVAMANGGAGAISALSDARVAELPEGVRRQFRLAIPGDSGGSA